MKLERIVKATPALDCKDHECKFNSPDCQPGTGGYHGIHGVDIFFVVKGPEGAVAFALSTGWYRQLLDNSPWTDDTIRPPMPTDLGYHSRKPLYDYEQAPSQKSCEFCDGEPCYYDGSGLAAEKPWKALIHGGSDGLWEFLEQYYMYVFHDAKYPETPGYPTPRRKKGRS